MSDQTKCGPSEARDTQAQGLDGIILHIGIHERGDD